MAEAAFRREAMDAGLDLLIDSAGTGDWHIGKLPEGHAKAASGQKNLSGGTSDDSMSLNKDHLGKTGFKTLTFTSYFGIARDG